MRVITRIATARPHRKIYGEINREVKWNANIQPVSKKRTPDICKEIYSSGSPLTSFQLPALFSRRPRHPVQTIADCSTTLYAIWKIHLNCQYIPSIIETTIVLISGIIKLAMFGIRYTIKNNTINPAIIFNWIPTENIFI